MPISKLEAAQRQLDCSIRLLLNLDDMPSVITLSRAAFRLLFDIYPVLNPEGEYSSDLDNLLKMLGWKNFNKIANQLKHADSDPDTMIDPDPTHAIVGIGIAITVYHQITGQRTPEMQAFESVMAMKAPEIFAGPHDLEAVGYEDFMKASASLKNATHEKLMEFGRRSLNYLKTGETLQTSF